MQRDIAKLKKDMKTTLKNKFRQFETHIQEQVAAFEASISQVGEKQSMDVVTKVSTAVSSTLVYRGLLLGSISVRV